jgi:branched-chain amino acid transport system permease protein
MPRLKSSSWGLAVTIALIALVLALVLPSFALATECLIFAMAALGCNLLLGRLGLLSFGQAIFFGAGAYCIGILSLRFGIGLVTGLFAATVFSALLAAVIGWLATQRTGVYLIMLTLALSQMFFFLCYAAPDLTGGDNGLMNIPRPNLALGATEIVSLATPRAFYVFVAAICTGVFYLVARLATSPFGATLEAIRDNEDRAAAIGYDTRLYKVIAFVVAGAVTGLAGALYALALKFVPLANVDLAMGERIIVMTILGGANALLGAMLGSISVVVLSYVLSEIWTRWQIVLGALLVAVALYLRGGLASLFDKAFARADGEGRP